MCNFRLCRLRGLQQAFHEQLEGLEDGQSNQMSESQQALKKDMYNLRKKILKENVSLKNRSLNY